jgi:hypothetical protein
LAAEGLGSFRKKVAAGSDGFCLEFSKPHAWLVTFGPRLWDEHLTLPGNNKCFASERNSSETRFATQEVSPSIRAILGKSDARTELRGAI